MNIILIVIAIMLPIAFGYIFRILGVFKEDEINTLRKFVVKVSVPFIIFKNLFKANMESLTQIYPAMFSLILLTLLFAITAYIISNYISKKKKEQNSYAFTTFAGNYGYLGWGVLYYLYGDPGFTRSVFFTLIFWPAFLTIGFVLLYFRNKKHSTKGNHKLLIILIKNASIPIISAILAISMNLINITIPELVWDFIIKFAGFTIPMILFTIGLNFKFRMKRSQLRIIISATAHRILFGFILGILTCFVTRLIFPVDIIMQKVILVESVMPTAAMSPFFEEYIDMDKKLVSGVIAFSTIFSLITIPFWFYIIEMIF
jgi:predicted permease